MYIGSIVCRTLCIVTATFATSANERSLPPARLDLRNAGDEKLDADVRGIPMPRHANVACTPVSVRACGRHLSSGCQMPAWLVEPPLSVPAPPHAYLFFFFFLQGTPRAFSREVQKRFFKGEKKAAVRQMPAASTNAYRHAGEIGGHEGWICHGASYRKKQTNQTAARKLTCTDMGESLACMSCIYAGTLT